MRLAGKAKAGFYPTPPRVTTLIKSYFYKAPGCKVLDPCAGEGVAVKALADHVKGWPLAIELSRERAAACKKNGVRTFHGDSLSYTGKGFGLLYLNPPYDDGNGERLERTFLKHWTPALLPSGVLVFIIPERVLEKVEDYLTSWYSHLFAFHFPEPEYQAFRQIVIFGVKREEPAPPSTLRITGVLGFIHHRYSVPAGGAGLLYTQGPSAEEALSLADNSPLWALFEKKAVGQFQPLLPLKDAHLALLLAGGLLNNQVVEIEGEPFLLRGQVQKTVLTLHEQDERREKTIERERFTVQVVALGLRSGQILEIK
jgi:hypothetical protein